MNRYRNQRHLNTQLLKPCSTADQSNSKNDGFHHPHGESDYTTQTSMMTTRRNSESSGNRSCVLNRYSLNCLSGVKKSKEKRWLENYASSHPQTSNSRKQHLLTRIGTHLSDLGHSDFPYQELISDESPRNSVPPKCSTPFDKNSDYSKIRNSVVPSPEDINRQTISRSQPLTPQRYSNVQEPIVARRGGLSDPLYIRRSSTPISDRLPLDPIQKWKCYHRFPFKLFIHVILALLIGAQVLSNIVYIKFFIIMYCR